MLSVWAHRGESGAYPENTLTAFLAALRYDIAGIEMDVQRSSDGELVVIHDETVDRTTGGTGYVFEKTLAELKALAIPAPAGRTESIPTLREVFRLLKEPCLARGLRLNLELKNSRVPYEGMEEQLLEAVREAGFRDHVIYSTFSRESVKRLKELDPEAEVGMLCQSVSECLEAAAETGADALHPLLHWQDVPGLPEKTALPVRGWNYWKYEPFYPEKREPELFPAEQAEELGFTDIITNFPGAYAPVLQGDAGRAAAAGEVLLFPGKRVDPETGLLTGGAAAAADGTPAAAGGAPAAADGAISVVNFEPFRVEPGDRFRVTGPDLACRLWAYSPAVPESLIYTYSYQEESSWTTFRGMLSENVTEFLFTEAAFVRAEFSLEAGGPLPERGRELFRLEPSVTERFPGEKTAAFPAALQAETRRVAGLLREKREPGDTVLFLLADTHYTVNGIWEDTLMSLKRTAEACRPDAVIHLGDLTDGLLPRKILEVYGRRVLDGLSGISRRMFFCVGNHDRNYFRGNPDVLTEAESAELYLGRPGEDYWADLADHRLRLIFLSSFDPGRKREQRYGYSAGTVYRLWRMLSETPRGYGVLVFSHMTLIPEMNVFSRELRGSRLLRAVLKRFHRRTGRLLAFVHGHCHADQVTKRDGYPVVSVGCGKLESFPELKPDGAFVPPRRRGERTQELWDLVRISRDQKTIEFIRYGAGESRKLSTGCGTERKA